MTSNVKLDAVVKRYGARVATDQFSLVLEEGETIALVGHNGAGKTTLIKLVLGLIRPDAGTICVLGSDPARGDAEVRRSLGYLPENVAFNLALTGRETLSFYARLKGESGGVVRDLLEHVGLGEAGGRRVGTYSKGMRQRLGLAQALIGKPRLLLLDEPTTGLDPALRQHFYEIVRALRDEGCTVLISSHALAEMEGYADRVVIMDQGRKIADGSIDDLRRIASMPSRIRLRTAPGELQQVETHLGLNGCHRRLSDTTIEVNLASSQKIQFIHHAAALEDQVLDIDVLPPSLDELYAHFLNGRAA
ncbi:ABC transporter ATP-binding protein [Paramesorhizobium deserti]|uniref:ABC transporter ATP-binding protein n=1 Tax=Paramesorhizobium deserti TaxID=1494590 RepID=A0A135HSC1_9HYPH|nr:ABC transporter ATP-binding protein [Paramesorhizobium deserti]KXF76088.1 ABC transporter ATP-binding protein [Paramesorhizobium deserti]